MLWRPKTIGQLLALLCLLIVSSCAERNSADDQIAGVQVSAEPSLVLGVAGGDPHQEFFRVVTPFLFADGRIVVPQEGTNSIRVFNPDGTFAYELGREGQGPGEFVSLSSAWARGDTIEAYDSRLARITRFLPEGPVQVIAIQNPPLPSLSAIPGAAENGWVLAGVRGAGPGARDRIVVTRFGRDGAALGQVAETQGMARFAANGSSGPEPLSPRARIRLVNDQVYIAETLTPTIRVHSNDGRATDSLTWIPDAPPDPGTAVRTVIDSAVARAAPDRAQSLRRRLEAAPIPSGLSVFWDFVIDDQGLVWVQSYDPLTHAAARGGLGRGSYLTAPARGGEWRILDLDGTLVGRVSIPADLEVVQITRGRMLGIAVDSSGVEQVRLHRVVRPD